MHIATPEEKNIQALGPKIYCILFGAPPWKQQRNTDEGKPLKTPLKS